MIGIRQDKLLVCAVYCLRRAIANDYSPRRTKLLEVHFCSHAQCTFAAMIGVWWSDWRTLARTATHAVWWNSPAYRKWGCKGPERKVQM
jgi:hypothetical protein